MKKSSFGLIKIAIILLLLLGLIALCGSDVNAKTPVDGWKMGFWKLKPLSGDYLTVSRGDSLVIRWDQPLQDEAYENQPSFGIGDTTGFKISIDIPLDSVLTIINSDSSLSCTFKKYVNLTAGSWAIIIYSYRESLYSKHSRAFWFRVSENPPMFPIEVKVFIKQ